MKHWKLGLMLAALLAAITAVPARAQEEAAAAEEEPERPWTLSAELGITLTTGNAKSRALDGGFDASYEHGDLKHTLEFEALYGASLDSATKKVETTDRRFEIEGKSEWSFTEHQFLYILANYQNDAFASYSERLSESIGYGIKLINEKTVRVSVEGGPAGRHTMPQGPSCGPGPLIICTRTRENEITGRAALLAEWEISENATLKEKAESTFGPKAGGGIVTTSTTSLKAQVVGSLALKAAFEVRHVSEIPAGSTTKDLDTKTTLKFVYDF